MQVWRRIHLADAAKKTKRAEDVAALQQQAERVEQLLSDAKVNRMQR